LPIAAKQRRPRSARRSAWIADISAAPCGRSASADSSRRAGYSRLELWTQSELKAARRIYVAAGFTLVAEETHESFGKPLVAETWVLELG
jgi:hypothetical protein